MRTTHTHLSLALLLLVSCNKNEVIIDDGTVNVPTIASTLNAFSYMINARSNKP